MTSLTGIALGIIDMVAKTRHSAQLRVSLQALAARLKATLPRKPTNSGGLAQDNLMARVDRWSGKGRYCTDPKTGWLKKTGWWFQKYYKLLQVNRRQHIVPCRALLMQLDVAGSLSMCSGRNLSVQCATANATAAYWVTGLMHLNEPFGSCFEETTRFSPALQKSVSQNQGLDKSHSLPFANPSKGMQNAQRANSPRKSFQKHIFSSKRVEHVRPSFWKLS